MRDIVRGTAEDFDVDLTADVPLAGQPVEIKIGRSGEWRTASWTGDAGTSRPAFTALTADDTLALAPLVHPVFARITHDDTRPVIYLGNVNVVDGG